MSEKRSNENRKLDQKPYDKYKEKIKERVKNWKEKNKEKAKRILEKTKLRNKDSYNKSSRVKNKLRKEQSMSMLGGQCVQCGEKDPNKLCIDHIFNDGNSERMLYEVRNTYRKIIRGIEIERYQVLCHNHNKKKRVEFLRKQNLNDDPAAIEKRSCTKCMEIKFIGEFVRDKHKKSGRKSECKSCSQQRYHGVKVQALEMVGRGKLVCVRCGTCDIDVLELDHVENKGCQFRKSKLHTGIHQKIVSGIVDHGLFQILCCNCNFEKHLTK